MLLSRYGSVVGICICIAFSDTTPISPATNDFRDLLMDIATTAEKKQGFNVDHEKDRNRVVTALTL